MRRIFNWSAPPLFWRQSVMAVCLVCAWATARSSCIDPPVLHVALIPQTVASVQERAQQPLLEALQHSTGKRVQLLPMSSYGAVIEGLLAQQVHVAELGPASYALLAKRSKAFAPFATLSNGAQLGSYHSMLVVRAGSDIRNMQALRGRTLALTDPSSTSGAIVPRLAWPQLGSGQDINEFFSRVVFMGSHDKALKAVHDDRVQAAFVSSSSLQQEAPHWRVLWRSPAIVGNPFVLSTQLCPAVQEAVRQAFLDQQQHLRPWLQARQMSQVLPVAASDYQAIQALLSAR